jgi:hypothetical protein
MILVEDTVTRKEAAAITRDVVETDRDWKAAAFAWARNADEERARCLRLEDALRSLVNEATGVLTYGEHALREKVGHTNVNCLQRRIAEAREALTDAREGMEE